MRSYSAAAARSQPREAQAERAAAQVQAPQYDGETPPVRTIIFNGQRMPPPSNHQPATPDKLEESVRTSRQIAEYVARLRMESQIDQVRATINEANVRMDVLTKLSEAAMTETSKVKARSVDLSAATKAVSAVTLGVCVFALVAFASTGLAIIHPFFASLTAGAAIIFYVIGVLIARADHAK